MKHPLAEVFGYPTTNMGEEADRHRRNKLCPYNNKVANCTKASVTSPLGVCSVLEGNGNVAITCPVRFREGWIIADDAARFFGFPDGYWTALPEIRLKDKDGGSAGNIDIVIVRYDELGQVTDFGALEIQAVYISGNVGIPFKVYMSDPPRYKDMDWTKKPNYPRPDYLSSSRKRLAPQLIFKGGILHAWRKKSAVALDKGFFATLPKLEEVAPEKAEIAWIVYEMKHDSATNQYHLASLKTVYTMFEASLLRITRTEAGELSDFMSHLQGKLTAKLGGNSTASDTDTLDIELS